MNLILAEAAGHTGHVELSLRLLMAAVLGAAVGLEREFSGHPSGLRTHITVALGAALFGVISSEAFPGAAYDPTRIAAQIVSGVGFLGAGAIIKDGGNIRGLTSAAGLWVSAALGLGAAFGMYIEASVCAVILIGALVLLKGPRRWLRERNATKTENAIITIWPDAKPKTVIDFLNSREDTSVNFLKVRRTKEFIVIEADLESPNGVTTPLLELLLDLPGVKSVESA